jgi:hypothetical protein
MFNAPPRRRQFQEAKMYSKLFYDFCVEPVVREYLKMSDPEEEQLSITRKMTRQLWENEDNETKAAMAVAIDNACAAAIEPAKGDGSERTPQEYQE